MGIPSLKASVVVLLLALAVAAGPAPAQDGGADPGDPTLLPSPTEPVNDFAGLLKPSTVAELNRKIRDFKSGTNPQVVLAVAIVRTTGGRDIFTYSLELARHWKVGTDADDNPSALLLIAVDDRKYFTQVSRDLEDELPDGLAGQLQRRHLVPAFKKGDYDKGVSDTIDAYISTIRERSGAGPVAVQTERRSLESDSGFSLWDICKCGLVILFILFFVAGRGFRRGSFFPVFLPIGGGGGGGGWGGGGGGFGGFSGGDFGGGGAGGDW